VANSYAGHETEAKSLTAANTVTTGSSSRPSLVAVLPLYLLQHRRHQIAGKDRNEIGNGPSVLSKGTMLQRKHQRSDISFYAIIVGCAAYMSKHPVVPRHVRHIHGSQGRTPPPSVCRCTHPAAAAQQPFRRRLVPKRMQNVLHTGKYTAQKSLGDVRVISTSKRIAKMLTCEMCGKGRSGR
jgi:hypothetical protein